MKKILFFLLFTFFWCFAAIPQEKPQKIEVQSSEKTLNSQWNGKRVAYLGDSVTDSTTIRGNCLYWGYLRELLGIEPFIYGVNGHQWNKVYGQAEKLYEQRGDSIDAIFIFAGTNDYNAGVPIGSFFDEKDEETTVGGPKVVVRHHRSPIMTDSTFCGRINKTLFYLKEHYPTKQIIILTPIHRGYAKFGDKNIQPDEYYCNSQGLFLETYVNTLKEGASFWSVPVIDLYSVSGLLPNMDSFTQYANKAESDRLHPSTIGHYRMAKTLQYQLLALPASF